MVSKVHQNYLAMLPASVRYDRALTAEEKLLYAEITATAGIGGFSDAPDAYFAELSGVSVRRIKARLSNLDGLGYIIRRIVGTGSERRREIYPMLGSLISFGVQERLPFEGTENNFSGTENNFSTQQGKGGYIGGMGLGKINTFRTKNNTSTGNASVIPEPEGNELPKGSSANESGNARIEQAPKGKRLDLDREKLTAAIVEAYPIASSLFTTKAAIGRAAKHLRKACRMDEGQAYDFLLLKTKAYADIRGENTMYVPSAAKWFSEHRYLDTVEAWADRAQATTTRRKNEIPEADYSRGFFGNEGEG